MLIVKNAPKWRNKSAQAMLMQAWPIKIRNWVRVNPLCLIRRRSYQMEGGMKKKIRTYQILEDKIAIIPITVIDVSTFKWSLNNQPRNIDLIKSREKINMNEITCDFYSVCLWFASYTLLLEYANSNLSHTHRVCDTNFLVS